MLIGSNVQKIMICAPSNFAIDEVISRISKKGFLGLKKKLSPDGLILRMGAMEHDPSPEVAKHTLDARLEEMPLDNN